MSALPPGPRGALAQTLRYALGPYEFYRGHAKRYGDVFTVPTLLGPLVVFGHPDGAREVYGADPDAFTRWATDAVSPLLGDSALTLTSGPRHRRDRKLLAPPFHASRMRAYGAVMRDAALAEAARWTPGRVFSLMDSTQALSLDVILRAVFGVSGGASLARFRAEILGSMAALSPSIMLVHALRREFGGFGPWARFLRARERIDAITYAQIRERGSRADGDDILSMMLAARYDDGGAMSEREVRDQLLTLVFAGHETTGIALAWAFYWLDQNAISREKLQGEIATLGPDPEPDALAALPYLEAVCHETLRLHPVIPEVIRALARPLRLAGWELPAGAGVTACTTLLHAREDVYPEPDAFRPERFLERKYSPFEYTPFGGGSRRCIGAAFALHTMKIALGSIVARYDVRVVDAARVKPRLRNLTVGPGNGIPVVVKRRG